MARTPRWSAAPTNACPDWTVGHQGERHRQRELIVQRTNFGAPNERGQAEGCLQHCEVIFNARPRAGAERDVLPAVATNRILRTEPVGSKVSGSSHNVGSRCTASRPNASSRAGFDRIPPISTSRVAIRAPVGPGGHNRNASFSTCTVYGSCETSSGVSASSGNRATSVATRC